MVRDLVVVKEERKSFCTFYMILAVLATSSTILIL